MKIAPLTVIAATVTALFSPTAPAQTATQTTTPAPTPKPAPKQAEDKRPNIVIILADDMGYSDMGSFGSEIKTPNLDSLAKDGVRFTNFYTHASSSPTRSMLLTGVDTHLNGLGNMDEWTAPNQRGVPGYEGYLNHGDLPYPNPSRTLATTPTWSASLCHQREPEYDRRLQVDG